MQQSGLDDNMVSRSQFADFIQHNEPEWFMCILQ